jgi:hypothetical protein
VTISEPRIPANQKIWHISTESRIAGRGVGSGYQRFQQVHNRLRQDHAGLGFDKQV